MNIYAYFPWVYRSMGDRQTERVIKIEEEYDKLRKASEWGEDKRRELGHELESKYNIQTDEIVSPRLSNY